jgi:hypothetical protein
MRAILVILQDWDGCREPPTQRHAKNRCNCTQLPRRFETRLLGFKRSQTLHFRFALLLARWDASRIFSKLNSKSR